MKAYLRDLSKLLLAITFFVCLFRADSYFSILETYQRNVYRFAGKRTASAFRKGESKMTLSQESYIRTQKQITMAIAMIRNLDLDEFIRAINYAETVGPLFDPTLYVRGADNMEAIKKVALKLQEVKTVSDELFEVVMRTQAKEETRKEALGKIGVPTIA